MTKHTYPKTYLRKGCYHIINDFTQLGRCFLVRYSDPSRPYQTLDEFREKLRYHLGASQILTGISTILLCRLQKKHLYHQIITPKRNSTEPIDIRRGKYFDECVGIPLNPFYDDLKFSKTVRFFGIRIKDVVRDGIDVEIKAKDAHNNTVIKRTDELRFQVRHTPKRCNFWHCDIVLSGKDGLTGDIFDPTTLTREELDSSNKVTKKTVALMALLKDHICHDDEIKRKPIKWEAFSDEPIGRKDKKRFKRKLTLPVAGM